MGDYMMYGISGAQEIAMSEFYDMPIQRVLLSKSERHSVWMDFKETRKIPSGNSLHQTCPALQAELHRAVDGDHHVQSAIFSECIYAQTLANQLRLGHFLDVRESSADRVPSDLRVLLEDSSIVPRYVYQNADGSISLVQAGGHTGVDAVLMAHDLGLSVLIEFKEPKAKTSEPDLPKYGESGSLQITDDWAVTYPQFMPMVHEQIEKSLNFFHAAGSNVNDFSVHSIETAVRDSYAGRKFADVVCTEDQNAQLTLLPANQLDLWADLKGEIRPAGRNHYSVWTPGALRRILAAKHGEVSGSEVLLPVSEMTTVSPRGGTGISRYKIHPLFFVRAEDVDISVSEARFRIENVRQLNPTISAHMYFTTLDVVTVRDHYFGGY